MKSPGLGTKNGVFILCTAAEAREAMILGLEGRWRPLDGLTIDHSWPTFTRIAQHCTERMRYRRRMGRLRDPLFEEALELAPSEEANHRWTEPRYSSSLSSPREGQ